MRLERGDLSLDDAGGLATENVEGPVRIDLNDDELRWLMLCAIPAVLNQRAPEAAAPPARPADPTADGDAPPSLLDP